MKIGIITYWRGKSNYGQIVQHWALQTGLRNLGHKPFLIRFFHGYNHNIFKCWIKEYGIADLTRAFIALAKGNASPWLKYKHDRKRSFKAFRNKYLSVSDYKYYSLSQLQNCPPEADAYITGSDQVWSQLLSNKENEVYFLNFGNSEKLRIAYAPSFSMYLYPSELNSLLRDNLARFDYVSCREYDGVEICKKAGCDCAQKVLDPTFLLQKSDYIRLINQVAEIKFRNHLYIYSLNISDPAQIRWNELKTTMKDTQYIVTPSDGYCEGTELFENEVIYSYCTLPEWLANIFYSKLVVTPSFHGIALAIILEKDFIYVPLKGINANGNNRILDLLSELGLTDRILSDNKKYSDIISKPIDWSEIKLRLMPLKECSVSFLINSLNLKK